MSESVFSKARWNPVVASAPCRVDMGGTLDMQTFSLTLGHPEPCTVNLALDLRTRVRLLPRQKGRVSISSIGFEDADYPADDLPFDHPLGLMFAVAAHFRADGVQAAIESSSPPRSALGGSSAAAVALAAAFGTFRREPEHRRSRRRSMALLAHRLEAAVAGVPCGLQDQLAAVFGGVNLWRWPTQAGQSAYIRQVLVPRRRYRALERCLLLAYCGFPHQSRDINGRWVRQYLGGRFRPEWKQIADLVHRFARALKRGDPAGAADAMNRELDLRCRMTADVLDDLGYRLVDAARARGCGARFAGAGGGGCLWALGPEEAIGRLRSDWRDMLAERESAALLPVVIDGRGVVVES